MLRALYLSLFNYSLTAPDDREFVGLPNYVTALTDPLFWRDTGITVLIMVVTVAVELVIGFAFAMVMHKVIFARGIDPHLDPDPLRHHHRGLRLRLAVRVLLHRTASSTAGCRSSATTSTGSARPTPSLIAIMVSEIWKTTPFMSLLLLAGLAQVSEDMIEAAKVDGATWWQRLWKVILPNMRAAIMVAVLFRALDAYRIFDNIFVMTAGANETESISFLTYRQTIEQFQLGIGSALSVLLFLSVLVDRVPDRQAVQGRPRRRAAGGMTMRNNARPASAPRRRRPDPRLVPAAGGLDHLAVVQVPGRPITNGSPGFFPADGGGAGWQNYDDVLRRTSSSAGRSSTRSASASSPRCSR